MSEKSLDQLINTLKSEAIEAADKQAMDILEKAQEQAKKIIKEAEAKREELLNGAERKAQEALDKGETALQQAARDLTVTVRHELLTLLGTVLEKEVEAAFTPHLMEDAIVRVVGTLDGGVALRLPEKLEKQLAAQIQKRLQNADNLTSITADTSLNNGFVITKTDQGWSYHISPEAVTELLHVHLSPKWVQILTNKSEA